MTDKTATCIFCERDSGQVPLLTLSFQSNEIRICTQHLPVLIHDPAQLVGKLAGAEDLSPADHSD